METHPLIRNHVTIAGNPTAAKTLLFVNGLGYDQSFWQHITPAFAADYRLVLFDHVGAIPANLAVFRAHQVRYLNVSGYAADLLEICAALNLPGELTLVGHSLGAMASLLAAIEQPTRFRQLILLGASPCYANSGDYQGGFSKQDIDASYDAISQNYHLWSQNMAGAAFGATDQPDLVQAFAQSLASIPPEIMLTVLCSVLQGDHRAALAKVRVPTLILQARQDYFVPLAVAQYLQAHLATSQLCVIDADGHLPHVSAPAAVIAAMQAYLG